MDLACAINAIKAITSEILKVAKMDQIHYSISRRDAQTLVYLGHEYLRKWSVGMTNADGSIPWRCKQYRTKVKCKASVTQLRSGDIKVNAGHSENCPPVLQEDELNAQLKSVCKKRSTSETTSLPQIFREEKARLLQRLDNIDVSTEKNIVIIFAYSL